MGGAFITPRMNEECPLFRLLTPRRLITKEPMLR